MGRRRSVEAEAEWRGRLEAWDASGLSLRAFALREGLCLNSLFRWKRRLRGMPPAVGSFARVVVAAGMPTPAGSFELLVRGGMSLRIPADFDEASLSRLVTLLGRT
jgi:hypothetical protein